ncbi:MAG: helix-turn-helix transcriptional regulator [Clostridiales bacterium]|nr:helix-turn-helix transcriptional regulator [Clostridiales bacterium]
MAANAGEGLYIDIRNTNRRRGSPDGAAPMGAIFQTAEDEQYIFDGAMPAIVDKGGFLATMQRGLSPRCIVNSESRKFVFRDKISILQNFVLTLFNHYAILFHIGEVKHMAISYNLLWKKLIDKGMKKSQLKEQAHISSNALAKLGKNEPVSLETLQKICVCLDCEIGDILEVNTEKSVVKGL